MKHLLTILACLFVIPAFGQDYVRRFTTLTNLLAWPPIAVVSGTNATVIVEGTNAPGDWGGPKILRYTLEQPASTNDGYGWLASDGGFWVVPKTNTNHELTVDAGLTLGGVRLTAWPASGDEFIWVNMGDYTIGNGSADDSDGIQAALDATPTYGTLYIPIGTYRVTKEVTRTTPITILGEGLGSVFRMDPAMTDNVMTITIGAGIQYEKFHLSNFAIYEESGTPGNHGIYIDVDAAGAGMSESLFENLYIRTLDGSTFYVNNSSHTHDGFYRNTFRDCALIGGMQFYGGGDSVTIKDSKITTGATATEAGKHGITWDGIYGSFGEAKGPYIQNNNITAAGGVHLNWAYAPNIEGNNIECYGPNTLWAEAGLISILGDASHPVVGGRIVGNFLGPASHQVDRAVYIDYGQGTVVRENIIPQVYGQVVLGVTNAYQGIYATPNSWKLWEGPNEWGLSWFGAANRKVVDLGRDTLRFVPVALSVPPYGPVVSWSNVIASKIRVTVTDTNAWSIMAPSFDYFEPVPQPGQKISITITNASGAEMGPITWASEYRVSEFRPPPPGSQSTVEFYLNSDLLTWIEDSVSLPWDRGMLVGDEAPFTRVTHIKLSSDVAAGVEDGTNLVLTLNDYAVETNELHQITYNWIDSKANSTNPVFYGVAYFESIATPTLTATNFYIGPTNVTGVTLDLYASGTSGTGAFARVGSPALTGTPTVNGTNLMAYIAAAGGGGDAYLGNNQTFTASNTFSGTLLVPLASTNDNSSKAASTAWALREFAQTTRRNTVTHIYTDLIGAGSSEALSPMSVGNISSGSTLYQALLTAYPGRFGYVSPRTASGVGLNTGSGAQINAACLTAADWLHFASKATITYTNGTVASFGFQDSFTAALDTDAIAIIVTNSVAYGVVSSNSIVTLTGTSWLVPKDILANWEVAVTNNVAYFVVKTNGVNAWSSSISGGLPNTSARAFGAGYKMWNSITAATNATTLGYVDDLWISAPNIRE